MDDIAHPKISQTALREVRRACGVPGMHLKTAVLAAALATTFVHGSSAFAQDLASNLPPVDELGLIPSVYHAESLTHCSPAHAWQVMKNFQDWEPSFVGATVKHVSGVRGGEGEVMLIHKDVADEEGKPLDEFVTVTARLEPGRRIVWYAFPKHGLTFRNFVDFSLVPTRSGTKFVINYFAQEVLPPDVLAKARKDAPQEFQQLANVFKSVCERSQSSLQK
ncbi:hypothetical protein [Novosphingobium sp. FKTRR1]|uniref:hypothetical protein n=1 Tax=Novosphingobium sp. FKTRR1 TaxID=2879118 RepID=UPI001CF04A44|nr:hypothetical protein [Novosphingobium sp. FKTRR1]